MLTSFGYRVLFLGHLLSVVVAFAPAMVWPLHNRRRRTGQRTGAKSNANQTDAQTRAIVPVEVGSSGVMAPAIHGAALVATGLFGIAQVAISDGVFAFDQTWVSIAFVLWFFMLGIVFALLIPAQRALREGDDDAEQRLAMAYGGLHLLLVLQIIDMIWKPGLFG